MSNNIVISSCILNLIPVDSFAFYLIFNIGAQISHGGSFTLEIEASMVTNESLMKHTFLCPRYIDNSVASSNTRISANREDLSVSSLTSVLGFG